MFQTCTFNIFCNAIIFIHFDFENEKMNQQVSILLISGKKLDEH